MDNLIIVGANTAAKQVYEFIQFHKLYNVMGFAVNKEYKTGETFLDKPLYELDSLSETVKERFFVFVAIQWNRLNADRRKVFEFCKKKNFKFANVISPTAVVRSHIDGKNCFIDDMVILMNNDSIGDDVFIKASAVIGPNVVVESHSFIAVHSTVGGGSVIGEQSFIGLGATVFDDVKIGKKCIVGASTSLKRNLPDFSVYKTSGETSVVKTYHEEEIEERLLFRKNVR